MGEIRSVEFTAIHPNSGAVGHFIFDIEETAYNEAANVSTVSVKKIHFWNNTYGSQASRMNGEVKLNGISAVTINGQYCESRPESNPYNLTPPANSTDVARASDGTLDIQVYAAPTGSRAGFALTRNSDNVSWIITVDTVKTVSFTPIPRGSVITSLTQYADTLGSISLIVSPKKAGAKHKVSFSSGGIGLYTSDFFDTSISVTVPRTWFNSFPNDAVLSVTASVQTYDADGTTIGDPVTGTVTLTADAGMKPTVSQGWAAVSPYNVGAAAEDIPAFVQDHSSAQVTFDSTKISLVDDYGASLSSYKIVFNGVSVFASPYRTGTIRIAGTLTISCYVYDTRGRYAAEELSFTVYPYSPPKLSNVNVFRCTAGGVQTSSGTYISVKALAAISSLNGLNSLTLTAKYKTVSGSYGSDITLINNQASVIGGGLISITSTYKVLITAIDALGNTAVNEATIPTDTVAFHIRDGGSGAAFGKYAENDNVLELPTGWNIKIGNTTLNELQLQQLLNLL